MHFYCLLFFLSFQSLCSVLFHTWKVVLNNMHCVWQTVEVLNDVIFLHGRFRFLLAVRENHFNLDEAELFPVCLYFYGVVLLKISKKTRTLLCWALNSFCLSNTIIDHQSNPGCLGYFFIFYSNYIFGILLVVIIIIIGRINVLSWIC